MKPETEMLLRNVLSTDPSIQAESVERVVDMLHGRGGIPDDFIHVVRFKVALELLHVHRMTLNYYLSKGYLDRVYGCGCRALGVSRESLLRFIHRRTVHPKPAACANAGREASGGNGFSRNRQRKGKHR